MQMGPSLHLLASDLLGVGLHYDHWRFPKSRSLETIERVESGSYQENGRAGFQSFPGENDPA